MTGSNADTRYPNGAERRREISVITGRLDAAIAL